MLLLLTMMMSAISLLNVDG